MTLSSPSGLPDAAFLPPPAQSRAGWLVGQVFAHRGLHGAGAPENSPAAFAGAIERKLGIECDVQRSCDGKAVVFHDWDLDRLTDATGPVRAHTAAALQAVKLKHGGDTLPTLPQILAQIGGQVPLLIEIKSKRELPVASLCSAVRTALAAYRGKVAVMSFDPRVAHWFNRHAPAIVRGLVVTEDGKRTPLGRWKRIWSLWIGRPDFLAYDIRDLPSPFAAAQRARGLPVLTWTVRDAALRQRAALYADSPIAEGEGLPCP